MLEALVIDHEPDIVLITETWLHEIIPDTEIAPPGYSMVRRDRDGRGGGVAFLVKKGVNYSSLDAADGIEAVWIKTKLNNRTVFIGGVYRPPNSPVEYILQLRRFMDSHFREKDNIILLGDFNLPAIDWHSHVAVDSHDASCDLFLDLIFSFNLHQVVNEFTRVCATRSSVLDLILLSNALTSYVNDCLVEEGLSDHKMIILSMSMSSCTSQQKSGITYPNFQAADDVSVLDFLERSFCNFTAIYESNGSSNCLWEYFHNITMECIRRFIPKSFKKCKRNNPWITRDIIHVKRRIKRKRKACSRDPSAQNKTALHNMRLDLNRLVKESKERFFNVTLKKFLYEAPSKFWRYVNPSEKQNTPVDEKIALERAENFNSFFSSVFTEDDGTLPSLSDASNRPPVSDPLINEEGVLNLLLHIDIKKSAGPDGIPNEFLYRYAQWVAKYLTIIFQTSINQASFPVAWKEAKIIPVHKSGNTSEVGNYRPISLTSTCSKLLEHILCKHLSNYLDTHNLLSPVQHGFRRGLSTVTQLVVTVHDFAQAINRREQIDLIFLDFAKAFDKVSHPKLLLKVNEIFRNSNITQWFISYLHSRTQYVEINKIKSKSRPVISGVPQGSVLGPLLFLIFINDLPSDLSVPVRLFADDCVIYNKITSLRDQVDLNNNLNKILLWCNEWQMVLNPVKSVCMSITRKKVPLKYNYNIGSHDLKRVTEYKYLGLIFTPDLRWNTHVDVTCRKANKTLWGLRRRLHDATPEVKSLAYKMLVRPIIEYCKIVWDPHTTTNLHKLEKVQRMAARFIFNKYQRMHSASDLCNRANLQALELRTKYDRLKFLFLIIRSQVKINSLDFFEISPDPRSRHKHTLYIQPPATRNDAFKYSFFPRAIKEWNELPNKVAMSSSITAFSAALESLIFSEIDAS